MPQILGVFTPLNASTALGIFLLLMVVAAVIVESVGGGLSPLTQLGGVSLLKRAILTAQKAGAKTCYLSFDRKQEQMKHDLQDDPRITSQLLWSSSQIPEAIQLDTHDECLLFPIDTIFRHPTIHVLTSHSLGRAVMVTDTIRVPMLALIPLSSLASVLTELREGKPWDTIPVLSTATPIYPPSGHGLFLRRLTATTPVDAVERELLLSLENPRDGQVDTYFNRKISRLITPWLLRTTLTPNQVTILSCLVGILGALCFFPGGYWPPVFGALLLQFSVVLDCCDGEIARVKFMESPLGDWLDIVCDTIVSIAIFLGIGVAVWNDGTVQHALVLAAVLVVGGALSFPFVTLAEKTEAMGEQRRGWEDVTIKKLLASLTTRDFSVIVVASAFIGKLHWFLWGAALGAHVFWLGLAWLLFRAGRFAQFSTLWERKEL